MTVHSFTGEPRVTVDTSMVVWAFRYCLGRKTYASQDCVSNILRVWGQLPLKDRQLIIREIRQAIKDGSAGMDMDVREWQKIIDNYESQRR